MPSDTTHASARRDEPFEGLRTVDVDGTALAYREQGEGEPVVFVHGSASDLRCWDAAAPGDWDVLSGDRLQPPLRAAQSGDRAGRGRPDAPPRGRPGGPRAGLDAAPAHLVGQSWGAFICLLAAIRRPELVRSLVLAEPPVLSLFMSTPPRPMELLRLFARRPRTAR